MTRKSFSSPDKSLSTDDYKVRQLLQAGTSRLHSKLDKFSKLSLLIQPDCNLHQYTDAMCRLAQAYKLLDQALWAATSYNPKGLFEYQPRSSWLERDLIALGKKLPMDFDATLPLPPPSSTGSYLGMRYVAEGAQLGGQVITKKLLSSDLASQLDTIGSFWTDFSQPANQWPAFLDSLEQLQYRKEIAHAIRSARVTFKHFIHYMT
ncbi:MAG: biliverdin-producing heme oxygenase [Gammaproteobacteria bacterium]|nr:biliverdin-producing heme oxygenase [Gammaproteobacteria bacterium]NNJ90074.1 biliverdin-producing heme oxygenase [Gammaproteobacteria bacterium]